MSRRPRKPVASIIVIVDRFSDRETIKRIKNSARTSSLVAQYFARQPDLFVYRVNVYAKANAPAKLDSARPIRGNSRFKRGHRNRGLLSERGATDSTAGV